MSTKTFLGIHYSTFDTRVESEQKEHPLWLKELRDLARGFCGGLVVALPLLYTMEMWFRAEFIPIWQLLLFLVLAYFINVIYIMFEGYKPEAEGRTAWLDAFTSLGIGLVTSFITLLLIGRYDPTTTGPVVARLVLLEAIPTSFGASLAINQLGERAGYKEEQMADRFPKDLQKILATVGGAFFFSFNIAPTLEPKLITFTINWWHILGIMLFSLFASTVMVSFANFIERDGQRGILGPVWAETIVSYLVSLLVSALLLWFFDYLDGGVPFDLALAWTITLGYVTTIGGSAGRLIL